jgi:Tol biopolymer transport system component
MSTGSVQRMSVGRNGVQPDGDSVNPTISDDGRYIAFASDATNFVVNDTNNVRDVFVRDRTNGTTVRVSVRDDETQIVAGGSDFPAISADGQRVAFQSRGNVVDDPFLMGSNGWAVALRIRTTGNTVPISVRNDRTGFVGDAGFLPAISGDGSVVAFTSIADLVPDDDNFEYDLYAHDVATGVVSRVSVDSDEEEGTADAVGGLVASLSADGRYAAFETLHVLDSDDDNGLTDVYLRDRVVGTTVLLSRARDGSVGSDISSGPSMSRDARYVAFMSHAADLVPDDHNEALDVFFLDRADGTLQRVSTEALGKETAGDPRWSADPQLSRDGRYVAFTSWASNLVGGDNNGLVDVFLRHTRMPEVTSISPSQLPANAATSITVHGRGFDSVLDLRSETNRITFSNVARVDENTVTATARVAADTTAGPWWIGVANAGNSWKTDAGSLGICMGCVRVTSP